MYRVEGILVDYGSHEAQITCAGSVFIITQADFEQLGINEGDCLDEDGYSQLCEAENRLACIKKAFVHLSYGDMSAKKLSEKLKKRFDDETITDVVELLRERNYLNDTLLAAKYAESFHEAKLWGPIRIKSDLYKRGFSKEDIGLACEFLEGADHRDNIKRIITAKYGEEPGEIISQKQKVCAYLYRMGYAYGDITDVIDSFDL